MIRPGPHLAAIETDIPFRLDRLPWTRFHWLLVIALGVTWVLDGLEATIVAAIGPVLEHPGTLGLRATQLGLAGTVYLAGCIAGALFFGHLTDRLGRKKLFTVTLGIYLAGAVLTAFSWDFGSFLVFRVVTGLAIGGEYSAINSAIDELIPARLRGRVDLAINGTYWLGAIAGAAATLVLLDPRWLPEWLGWRFCFALGGLVGFGMILARRHVPESPRWLLTHGRREEADAIMHEIEAHAVGHDLPPVDRRLTVHPGVEVGFGLIARTLLVRYRSRALLGFVLIASQAFFYNGISFTYPLVLNRYFNVAADRTGAFVIVMAVANFLGPLLLGGLFDSVGRRRMIAATYAFSGVVIVVSEVMFLNDRLNATTQTLLWAVTFFSASAAASAGYLTVSEIFPLEMRALAIALFYALGTAVGGLAAPALFGALIDTGRRGDLFWGYVGGAALMVIAAGVEWLFGVDSERKSLEEVASPLSSEP
ncbi:MAG TPA: MFS transporter [Gemmataceae bacterium]|nr:MFS transporter [Gemmataceae bacterium]